MNTSLHFHRAFTTLMSALLRTSLLWFGGAALFADLTTVGHAACQRSQFRMSASPVCMCRVSAQETSVHTVVQDCF
jgi:hypothetical protein